MIENTCRYFCSRRLVEGCSDRSSRSVNWCCCRRWNESKLLCLERLEGLQWLQWLQWLQRLECLYLLLYHRLPIERKAEA